jgi:hypothetical protein
MSRWDGITLDERRAAIQPANDARSRRARERVIRQAIAKSPPLLPEQRARLIALLSTDDPNSA